MDKNFNANDVLAFADDVKKAVSAGMNGHIAKPVDLAVLQKNLVKWIKE